MKNKITTHYKTERLERFLLTYEDWETWAYSPESMIWDLYQSFGRNMPIATWARVELKRRQRMLPNQDPSDYIDTWTEKLMEIVEMPQCQPHRDDNNPRSMFDIIKDTINEK